jgi:hypothetical protein
MALYPVRTCLDLHAQVSDEVKLLDRVVAEIKFWSPGVEQVQSVSGTLAF